jgi:hypothetical protein
MAAFALDDGEHVLHRERVRNVREKYVECELILTDRRIVLTSADAKPNALVVFGALGGVLGALLGRGKARVSHEVRRERFGRVARDGQRDLRIESTGEGYGKTFFDLETKHADDWADRIHAWAAGSEPAPLPPAKLVDR